MVLVRKTTPHLRDLRGGILHSEDIEENRRCKMYIGTLTHQCRDHEVSVPRLLHHEVSDDKNKTGNYNNNYNDD